MRALGVGVRATQLLGPPGPSGPGRFSCSPGRGPPSPSNTKYMTVSRKSTAPAITSRICQTCTSSPLPGTWGRAGPGPGGVAHARACLTAPHRRTSWPWATSRVRWENSNFDEVNHHVRGRVRRQPSDRGWPPASPRGAGRPDRRSPRRAGGAGEGAERRQAGERPAIPRTNYGDLSVCGTHGLPKVTRVSFDPSYASHQDERHTTSRGGTHRD